MKRALLTGGALAGPAFVASFLVEGARRPGYDPMRHPVSSLALGPGGWRQVASFATAGSLYLGLGAALRRSSRGDSLVSVAVGAGLLASAVFTTDPVSGYPAGTPAVPAESSAEGRLHDLAAIPIFLALPVAQFVTAWRCRGHDRRWALISAAAGVGMVSTFVPATMGFAQQEPFVARAGLFQRIAAATGLLWLSAKGWRAR